MNESPSVPLIDVEQPFPVLTADVARRRSSAAAPDDLGPAVSAAIGDVLGWRPRPGDPRAFEAALTAAFDLALVEGHVVSTFRPRGFSAQADLGAVSGGQASLYARALNARTQILTLLDSLVPLRVDADPDDCAAFRGLVRGAISRLVDELGMPGGPRLRVVDSAFTMLTGWHPGHRHGGVHVPNVAGPDTVGGQLGALRDRFGLVDQYVNTVDEERVRTSYWTMVDLVTDLQRAWAARRGSFMAGGGTEGFLGTELVQVSRLLHACAEQVDELEDVLDSVLVGAAERQTLVLDQDGLTLAGLLDWLRTFLTVDGVRYAQDGGRDGMLTAFTPTVIALSTAVAAGLGGVVEGSEPHETSIVHDSMSVTVVGGTSQKREEATPVRGPGSIAATEQLDTETVEGGPVVDLPLRRGRRLPAGMRTGRVRIAVASLLQQLDALSAVSARISRYPRVVLIDVAVQAFHAKGVDNELRRVTARGVNLQPSYGLALSIDDELIYPLPGTSTADGDSLDAVFHQSDFDRAVSKDQLTSAARPGWLDAAYAMRNLVVIDRETGRKVAPSAAHQQLS